MAKQTWKGYRVNSLPTTGDTRIKQANRFYLNVGGGKFKTYIVNNLLQLTTEAGAEFIECDTMEQMRALDARQIWALQNGYYKGVKLNGYYSKGDTPTPIEYYLSDTVEVDDGGSIIEIGGAKLEHDFGNELNLKYYGLLSGDPIDTLINSIVVKHDTNTIKTILIPEGYYTQTTQIGFRDGIGFVGIGRVEIEAVEALTLQMGTLSKIGFTTALTLTKDINPADVVLEVSSTAGIASGDFIRVTSNQRFTRDWDHGVALRSYYLDGELLEVKEVTSPTEITLINRAVLGYAIDDIVNFDFFTPNKNNYVDNIILTQFKNTSTSSTCLGIRYATDFKVGRVVTNNANIAGVLIAASCNTNIDSWKGVGGDPTLQNDYGIQLTNGSKYTNIGFMVGEGFRHTFAISGSGDFGVSMFGYVGNVVSNNTITHGVDAHANSAYFTFGNIFSDASFMLSGLGHVVLSATSLRGGLSFVGGGGGGAKDCTFQNITMHHHGSMNMVADQTGERGDIIGCRFYNVKIYYRPTVLTNNFFGYWRSTVDSKNNVYRDVEIINEVYDSTLTGDQNADRLYNKINEVITFREGDVVENFYVEGFRRGVIFGGNNTDVKRLVFKNCGWTGDRTATTNPNTMGYMMTLNSSNLKVDNVEFSYSDPTIDTSNSFLFRTSGSGHNNISISDVRSSGGNASVLLNGVFFNSPVTKFKMRDWDIIPLPISNVVNSEMLSSMIVDNVNFLVNRDYQGLNQSVALTNSTATLPVADTASVATDVPELLVDFNDLLSKYNSLLTVVTELQSKLNSKLANDRASGQQA